jgi:hypothetical protein
MRSKLHQSAMILAHAALLLPSVLLAQGARQGAGMEAANRAYRMAVDSLLRTAASTANVQLSEAPFVAGSDGEVLIANAAVAGVDSLSEASLRRGANVLFVYISSSTARLAAPAGFYVIRLVTREPGRATVAQFVAQDGRVVAERRVIMSGSVAAARPRWKIKLTGKFGRNGDWEVDIELEPREAAAISRMGRSPEISIVVPLGGEVR